ncbi:MAG: rRNA adenine N-6-methyltransferase family protein [Byssovorax sp.]
MDRLDDFRHVFSQMVVARAGSKDPAVLAAFSRVARHEFMGPGPWQVSEHGDATPSADPALVYQDIGMGLSGTITTGLPSLHARCMTACALRPGERVVQVGAGSGYFTAILAELVGETGSVVAYEVEPHLAARAQENLSKQPNVRVVPASGVRAFDDAADVIYVFAAVQQLPLSWLESLSPSGRLLFPLTPMNGEGGMLLVRRTEDSTRFDARFLCRVRFVPCIGAQDHAMSKQLTAAFASGGENLVRTLGLGPTPESGTWLAGDGWWLSAVDAPG